MSWPGVTALLLSASTRKSHADVPNPLCSQQHETHEDPAQPLPKPSIVAYTVAYTE
jgi:hypothetical protein